MKNVIRKGKGDWDTLYKTDKNPFGIEPSLLVTKYIGQFPKGKPVLDLGCGSGRNALFVAQNGFKITCVDISSEAIKSLIAKAKELRIESNINAITQDAVEFDDYGEYGAVMCYTALHFLSDENARRTVKNIKEHTINQGLNIIADFAGDGPLKRNNGNFWLKNEELKSLYSDWEILLYQEELSKTKATDETGKPFMQNIARLVAKK